MDDREERMILMTLLTLLTAMCLVAHSDDGVQPASLYADKRALRQNDVVTILLMEYTQGTNAANTDGQTRHDFQLSNESSGLSGFLPGFGVNAKLNSDQRASGTTTRQGTLRGKMSAQIVEIMPNGNLKIQGRRSVVINGEEQTTVLTGTVRPSDILADNTIYSYLIADASIAYQGKGMVNDAAKPGLISRFLNWLF